MEKKMFKYTGDTNILITGDLHINYRLSKPFEEMRLAKLKNSLKAAVNQQQNNILILSGDIFDKPKPTYEELAVFYDFLEELKEDFDIYVIAGNHEELSKKKTLFDYIPQHNFTYIKYSHMYINDITLTLVGHPYLELIDIDYEMGEKKILISHYRSDIGFAEAEIDNNMVSEKYDMTILSDIHYDYEPYENIIYTSSPYSIHFEKTHVWHGFVKLEITENDYKVSRIATDFGYKVSKELLNTEVKDYLLAFVEEDTFYNLKITGELDSDTVELLRSYPNVIFSVSMDEEYTIIEEVVDELENGSNENILEVLENLLKEATELDEEVVKNGIDLLRGA